MYVAHNTVCNLQQVSHSILHVTLTTLSNGIIFQPIRICSVHIHSDRFQKYGAHRNGCAHLCGIGYALTITVTCEHTEQLTLVESDPEMRLVRRRVRYRLGACNLKANIFARGWNFDIKLPSIDNRKNEVTLPSNDSVIDHAEL